MKRKFLITIGLVLTLAVVAVGVLQTVLFRTEQYRQIDSRIETTASLLISSDLQDADLKEFEEAEDIIADTTGGERFNQFIVIYGRDGHVIYRSPRADELPELIPTDTKWQTIEHNGHIIRVLTLPLAPFQGSRTMGRRRILQTGLILDEDLLRWTEINRYIIIFSFFTILMILLATFSLSEALLRPLKDLAQYLRYVGRGVSERRMVTDEARGGQRPLNVPAGNDEFGQIVKEVQALHGRINDSLRNTQAWTAQMAHEMKTPLTILQNSLERAKVADSTVEIHTSIDEASTEVAHLNALITGFLDWASAENFSGDRDIVHAVRIEQMVSELSEKIERQNPGRLVFQSSCELRVFAKRSFVQQAISNLITNALKYSPADQPVVIEISGHRLTVTDSGPGLPVEVEGRIGRPFNHGIANQGSLHVMREGDRGFGLGLAWVSTICHKYGWSLQIERREIQGGLRTVASISFPDENAEVEP